MYKQLLAGLLFLANSASLMAQSLVVVEDGESGSVGNWQVFDANPAGFEISNKLETQNRFISFTSEGRLNGFMLGNTSSAPPGLNLPDASLASFRIRATAGFTVDFIADTDFGVRYIRYSHSRNTVPRGASSVVSIGLGTDSYNGYWQSYSRDLQADLFAAQPGNNILAINGIRVRGSIDLDDVFLSAPDDGNAPPVAALGGDQQVVFGQIFALDGSQSSDVEGPVQLWRWTDDKNNLLGNTEFLNLPADQIGRSALTLTVVDESGASNSASVDLTVLAPEGLSSIVEDAEQGDTSKWRATDRTPEGYAIDNREEDGNRFIALTSTDRQNAFTIGNRTATAAGLGLENRPRVSWRMRADDAYTLLFAVDTIDGFRYLIYNHARVSQPSGTDRTVRTGLGSLSRDGKWHLFNRDLQADLQQAQPDNTIVSVNGLVVRGSLDIDDLIFHGDEVDTPEPLVIPGAPVLSMPEAGQNILPMTMTTFSWQAVDVASTYQFELTSALAGFDDPLLSITVDAQNCSVDLLCTLDIELPTQIPDTYAWRVKAINVDGESDWSSRNFEMVPPPRPLKPVNLSPEVGADFNAGATVEFVWQFDPVVSAYDFHVFNRNTSEAVDFVYDLLPTDVCEADTCSFTAEVTLPIGENHAWRIRAGNASGKSDWSRSIFNVVEVVSDPPATPILEAPANQITLEAGTSPAFSWQQSATATSYTLRVVSASALDEILIDEQLELSACLQSVCSVSVNLDLPAANDYLWQVTAGNAAGVSAAAERSFTIVAQVTERPPTPVNVLPAPATEITQNSEVEFVWERDPAAVTYEFHIFDNVAKTTTPYVVGLVAGDICSDGLCRLTQTVTQPVATYHAWRVRGRNSLGPSSWSRSIFTVIESSVDPDPENAPPTAAFVFTGFDDGASGAVPFTVSVDPSASTDDEAVVSYRWMFGDGSEVVELTDATAVEHTYTEPGDYTLILEVSDEQGLTGSAQRLVSVVQSPDAITAVEAARLLTQASFGPTPDDIEQVQILGIQGWLERQFALSGESHLAYVQQYSNNSGRAPRHEVWWKSAVDGEDQLRQRVAFALSQLFVVSDTGYTLANAQYGITAYYQMLLDNAFGNYRELLEDVTLHPVMGIYLSMLQNGRGDMDASTRPDENYAREVLQLFSIGLYRLNTDGSTDGSPAFTQDQVEAFARVFTGWNYSDAGRWDRPLFTNADMINPMEPFENYHDTDEKVLLNGEVVPAGLSARADLERALDNIFNHPNVGPFVVTHLIKRLVTSNPSRQYVRDIAAVFNDDGSGIRGNLQAVVRALLLHDEARNIPGTAAYGKLREPVLRLSHLWRVFGVLPGSQSSTERNEYNTVSPQLMDLELDTGQAPLKSPSVFNFFQPSYAPVGPIASQNLKAPEFELFTEGNELATSNRIGRQIQQYSVASISDGDHPVSYLDFSYEVELADDIDVLLDHLNVVVLGGNMSSGLRDVLFSHLQALPDTPPGRLSRVRDALTLIMASPDYLVQM